jgi:hypothetical protein
VKAGLAFAVAAGLALTAGLVQAQSPKAAPNELVGTWRMVSATLEEGGQTRHPYGPRPAGMLVFTADRHFVEVLTDADTPRFASETRGEGTDAENRRAMAGGIGFFGTYTVDSAGRFSGNRVDGATFPNWIDSVRTTRELKLVVQGDRMFETFTRPGGAVLHAEFRRVTSPPETSKH